MLPTLTKDTIDLAPGSEIVLRQQTWDDYEQLLEQHRDRAGLRVEFYGTTGEIRIMSPFSRDPRQDIGAAICRSGVERRLERSITSFQSIFAQLQMTLIQNLSPPKIHYQKSVMS
ncbi:MAG: hypothetical protein AAFY57_09940 [Cyanobacteria bacterium J06642_2]